MCIELSTHKWDGHSMLNIYKVILQEKKKNIYKVNLYYNTKWTIGLGIQNKHHKEEPLEMH